MNLWMYLEEQFIPSELKEQQPGTADEYRKAVRRFLSFCGADIGPADVSEFLVERWLRSMVMNGVGWKTATAWATYVRRVVRTAVPDRCHKKTGKRPHEGKAVEVGGLTEAELRTPARSLLRFFEDEYVPRRMIGAKQGSIDQIKWTIHRFARFLGRAPIVSDLNDGTVSGFLNWMLKAKQLAVSTTNNSRQHLVSLWNYAVRRKLLLHRHDVEKIKQPRQIPRAWTLEEFGTLLRSAETYQTRSDSLLRFPASRFFPALFLVAYDTGLRLGALLSIRSEDWKPSRAEVTVNAEFQKQAVAQTFSISSQALAAVQRMLDSATKEGQTEFLFDWPLRRDQIFVHMRKILQAAGLYEAGMDTFHRIRKTSATHLTAAVGIETASRQLGHSSTEMTRRYVDVRLTGNHNAAEHLPRPKVKA